MPEIKTIRNDEFFADVEHLLDDGLSIEMRVKGYSMRPFLRNERDKVHLSAIDTASLKRGMVVLFLYRNHHTLHRIRRIDGNRLLMKGDGNYRSAELVTRDAVAAYVKSVERSGREIKYGSLQWFLLSVYSIKIKILRTAYIDMVRFVKRILGIKE